MSTITLAAVQRARHAERISISSPGDFVLGARRAVTPGTAAREAPLPYCLDFLRRRAVYAGGVDVHAAQRAPFYYLHLRRTAQRVAFVPWEAAPLSDAPRRAPIFLFSPGRCGSTLLSRMLSAAGVANVSEPDFYTQATSAACSSRFNPLRDEVRAVIAAMGADLAAALDPVQSPVVKLRAESCRAPHMLLDPRERRTLFLTRGFEAWARSNGRAFRNGARKSVGKYLSALQCLAQLRRVSDCHLVHYEALLADPQAPAADLARVLGRPISPQAVASTMTEDSQEGTPVARGARPDRPGWEKRFDETMALWNSARVKALRERLEAGELQRFA